MQWGVSKDTESSGSDRVIKVTGLLFTQPPTVVFSRISQQGTVKIGSQILRIFLQLLLQSTQEE